MTVVFLDNRTKFHVRTAEDDSSYNKSYTTYTW